MLFLHALGLMVVGHALADYPLQGDFLAKAKNRFAPLPGVPWWQALLAHSVIHAGAVYLITGLWYLALLELVSHFVIDDQKCSGAIGFSADQALHVWCKVMWAALLWGIS